MENPLDTTTNTGESLARRLQGLEDRCLAMERARRPQAGLFFSHSLVEAKASLPFERGTNGQMFFVEYIPPGTAFSPRLFIFLEEAGTLPEKGHQVNGRWFELTATEV